MVLSGHIHISPFYPAGSWVDLIEKTWIFNPGQQLAPTPAYVALDLESMKAEWISLAGQSIRQLVVAYG